ncbi:MAG: metallophosphoesterase, partial [Bacteroidetes bacterium]
MNRYMFTLLPFLIFSFAAFSQTMVVKPYLQNAEPTSIHIMWETSSDNSTSVEYGLTSSLGTSVSGAAVSGSGTSFVHDVELTGLNPATKYYYRAVTGNLQSATYHFITPPLKSSEASFNIVATSDMQQDWQHPTVFSDIINDNLIPYVQQQYGPDLAEHLAYFFVPGDL